MPYLFVFFCLLCLNQSTYGQSLVLSQKDTSSSQVALSLAYEVKAKHMLEVHENKSCFDCPFNDISDNPFRHQAIYGGVNLNSNIKNKYFAELGIYLEERSFSGGSNTVNNWAIFPKLKFHSIDSFKIGGKEIVNKNLGGDLWDEDFDDILRIYNFDAQGLEMAFGLGNYWLTAMIIGDASRNIGLGLHELYKLTVEYRGDDFKNTLAFNYNQLIEGNTGHPTPTDINLSEYVQFKSKQWVFEGQVEFRINRETGLSMASGLKAQYEKSKFILVSALRYYSFEFNRGYSQRRQRFRSANSYVGTQLYPLKNYYRPMNQWMLISENRTGAVNFECRMQYEKPFYNKLAFFTDMDLNLIYRFRNNYSRWEFFPLYDLGIQCSFVENYRAFISLSNKHMNLDKTFQTFYAGRVPVVAIGFQTEMG